MAFTGHADGSAEVYIIPVTGGEPRRLTYDPYGVTVLGWSSDSRSVLYRSARQNDEPVFKLWSVPATGGAPRPLPLPPISAAAPSPDGRQIAYVPPSYDRLWFGYRGGQAGDIWVSDTVLRTFRKLTTHPGVDNSPCWSKAGLYFVSEQSGSANLFLVDPGKKHGTVLTHFQDYPVRSLGCDDRSVVFEHGTGIGVLDVQTGKLAFPSFTLAGWISPGGKIVGIGPGIHSFDIAPGLDRVLLSSRGQVASVNIASPRATVLSNMSGVRAENAVFAPDGRSVAFVSDVSGDEEVWLQPTEAGGKGRQLTNQKRGPLASLVWSPDGKWLAAGDHELGVLLVNSTSGETRIVDQGSNPETGSYSSVNSSYRFSSDGRWLVYSKLENNDRQSIYLFNILTGARTRVTPRQVNSFSPVFDPEGRYLYFLADREYNGRRDLNTRLPYFGPTTRVSLITLRKILVFLRCSRTEILRPQHGPRG